MGRGLRFGEGLGELLVPLLILLLTVVVFFEPLLPLNVLVSVGVLWRLAVVLVLIGA